VETLLQKETEIKTKTATKNPTVVKGNIGVLLQEEMQIKMTIAMNALEILPAVVKGSTGDGEDQGLPALKAVDAAMVTQAQMKAEVAHGRDINTSARRGNTSLKRKREERTKKIGKKDGKKNMRRTILLQMKKLL